MIVSRGRTGLAVKSNDEYGKEVGLMRLRSSFSMFVCPDVLGEDALAAFSRRGSPLGVEEAIGESLVWSDVFRECVPVIRRAGGFGKGGSGGNTLSGQVDNFKFGESRRRRFVVSVISSARAFVAACKAE